MIITSNQNISCNWNNLEKRKSAYDTVLVKKSNDLASNACYHLRFHLIYSVSLRRRKWHIYPKIFNDGMLNLRKIKSANTTYYLWALKNDFTTKLIDWMQTQMSSLIIMHKVQRDVICTFFWSIRENTTLIY